MSEGQRVYVVHATEVEDWYVLGVFSNPDDALAFAADNPDDVEASVWSWELDNPDSQQVVP